MTEKEIQQELENLGRKVSILAEENRVSKNRDNAGRDLITLLDEYIVADDWVKIYNSTDDPYIKDIMKNWGENMFPKDFF